MKPFGAWCFVLRASLLVFERIGSKAPSTKYQALFGVVPPASSDHAFATVDLDLNFVPLTIFGK